MSDLGVLVPILTPPGTSTPSTALSARATPQPAANGSAVSAANAAVSPAVQSEETIDPITGQPTSALSAGLALVLQSADTDGQEDVLQGNATSPDTAFRPIDPVEETIDALTGVPADGLVTPTAGAAATGVATPGAAETGIATTAGVATTGSTTETQGGNAEGEDGDAEAATAPDTQPPGPNNLTEEERRLVAELQRIDAEIRRHEQAHAAVGGQYAGAPAYDLVRGPDGRLYAVGGEVRIDASRVPGNPEATIRKLQVVRRAALAPSQPSAADRRAASIAQQGIAEARRELRDIEAAEREQAQETREESAARLQQVQAGSELGLPQTNPLEPLNLNLPTIVRSNGPFIPQSRILRVLA